MKYQLNSPKVWSKAGPWQRADAGWFHRHPDRTHHARRMMMGEADSLDADDGGVVLVRQLGPGMRLRVAFTPEGDTSDQQLAIFEQIASDLGEAVLDGVIREAFSAICAEEETTLTVKDMMQRYYLRSSPIAAIPS